MVHSAYDLVELVKGCNAKIESFASYGSKILVGCSDGSLRIYAPTSSLSTTAVLAAGDEGPTPSELEIRRETYAQERVVSGFWKRAPVAMEVCRSRDLLLSLSEWIVFHRLPNLETVVAIAKTKGANVYSWDDRRGFLCVGRQKRVGIYRLDGGREFVEVKEFSVSDVVKSLAWCGENICLGIGKEYIILNSATGASSKVFSSGRSAPLVVPLPSGELILGKDDVGVFVDQNGKLLQDGRICWSEAPASIVIHKPYGLARLPRHVEIRSLRSPYPLVQTVVLRDVHLLLQSSNCVMAAVGNSIYGLLPVPLGAQIVQLTASGNFEEALSLCELLPPEDSSLRAAKEASIHLRYGHYLFDNGSCEESMEQFFASQVDITYILSLYPSIILPKDLTIAEPEKYTELTDAYLSRVSSDVSDEIESSSPSQLYESDDKSAIQDKKMSYNALMALSKYLQRKRYGIIERATAEVTEEVVSDAVQGSITSSELYGSKSSIKKRGHANISSVGRDVATILDTALIQALLLTGQTLGALELLKGPNYCYLKICEDFLRERKDFSVLLELYKCNEMHREALKLLHQLDEESNSGHDRTESQNFKPSMIIDYLKPLCRTDPMLVLEFSTPVLEKCPTETIELFLSGNVPADLVNSYLKQHAPNLQSTYLELMLSMSENGIKTNLQRELVQIYLSEVMDWYKDFKEQLKWDEKIYSPTRKKLLTALDGLPTNSAEALLKRLPSDALFEERAILLGKINQHQLALSIYVHKLHLPELALAYCDRVYELGLHQPSRFYANIYLNLLQIYLNPMRVTKEFEQKPSNPSYPQNPGLPKLSTTKYKLARASKKIAAIEGAEDVRISTSSTDSGRSDVDGDEVSEGVPVMLNEALELLSQRWDRINGAQALRLLPRDTKLQNLRSFLVPLLRKSSEGLRNFSVVKNLRYSENLQVKEELYKNRRTVVKIDGDTTCALCHKKIGTSVFAVYPNGKTIVHFVCFRDSQNIMAVRVSGTKRQT